MLEQFLPDGAISGTPPKVAVKAPISALPEETKATDDFAQADIDAALNG